MPESKGGVCYQNGEVVKENFQNCEVTNRKIRDLLEEKVPEVTFTCNREDATCDFQCKSNNPPCYVCAYSGKSGLMLANHSIAHSTPVPLVTITHSSKTLQTINATILSVNAFQIGCCVVKTVLSISASF